MDISFVPSLEHLSSTKVITLLLDDPNVGLKWRNGQELHFKNIFIVTEQIKKLIPGGLLKTKLEDFISPMLCDVKNWVHNCEKNFTALNRNHMAVMCTLRYCWKFDGTIDQEKSAKILIKNSCTSPLDQFVLACVYCLFDDVLDIWNVLSKIEKAFLRHKHFTLIDNPDSIVRMWIEWLDSNADKDLESFAAWTLGSPLWKNNVFILKFVFQTLSPEEKKQHLLKALLEKEVNSDVMKYGLQLISKDEREMIFRKSPVEAFKFVLTWPTRRMCGNLAEKLSLYVTSDNICDMLMMILNKMKDEEIDYLELLIIIKRLWALTPEHCKETVEEDSTIMSLLNFVLEYDFSKEFSRGSFLKCFRAAELRAFIMGVIGHDIAF